MKKHNSQSLVLYSLFIALVATVTYFGFPMAFGYINLGDAVIFSIALVFGPVAGLISGAIGSALADVILGYAVWAPFTFVIKGLEGYLVGLASVAFMKYGFKSKKVSLMLGFAFLVLNVGYFFTGAFLYSFPAAIADAPLNIVQGIVAISLALPLAPIIKRVSTSVRYTLATKS